MGAGDKLTGLITRIIECDEVELSGYADGPERSLLSALLFDGIQSYFSYALNDSPAMKDKYKEAFNWVQSNDQEYVFSFCNVCEAVGVHPQALRLGLLNYVNSNKLAMIQSIPTPQLDYNQTDPHFGKGNSVYKRARRTS